MTLCTMQNLLLNIKSTVRNVLFLIFLNLDVCRWVSYLRQRWSGVWHSLLTRTIMVRVPGRKSNFSTIRSTVNWFACLVSHSNRHQFASQPTLEKRNLWQPCQQVLVAVNKSAASRATDEFLPSPRAACRKNIWSFDNSYVIDPF